MKKSFAYTILTTTSVLILLASIVFYLFIFVPLFKSDKYLPYDSYAEVFCYGKEYEECLANYSNEEMKDLEDDSKIKLGVVALASLGFVYVATTASLYAAYKFLKND